MVSSGEHLSLIRLKTQCGIKRGASPRPIDNYMCGDSEEGAAHWIRIGDTQKGCREITDTKLFVTAAGASKSVLVAPGDLLLSNSMSFGEPYISAIHGYIHDGWLALTPSSKILKEYLYWCLLSEFVNRQFRLLAQGATVNNLNTQMVRNVLVPARTLSEQSITVKHLDTKTARIDGLIGKLTRQVELLERYRRELIAHTVTRGLNPDVPMKDSGIDWVGEIPGNWKTVSLSVITDENRRKNADLAEKNLLSLSYGEIIRKSIDLPFGLLPASFDGYQVVDSGYIILRMTDLQNDKRSLRTGLAHERGIITGAYIGLIPRGAVVSSYLAWLLRFYDLAKVFYSLGGGVRQSANYKEVGKLSVLLPPIEEQQQIADYLDQKNAEIDSTISGIRKQIELLGRYRKQVINDLVTGKVRVEEVA